MQYSIDSDNRRSNQHVWDVADVTGCHKFRLHLMLTMTPPYRSNKKLKSQSNCNHGLKIRFTSRFAKANRRGKSPVRGESFPVRPPQSALAEGAAAEDQADGQTGLCCPALDLTDLRPRAKHLTNLRGSESKINNILE